MQLQHRLVRALQDAAQDRATSGTVSRSTGIPAKTCQRHLSGAQLLGPGDLILWHACLGLDVAALIDAPLDALIPEGYRSVLRTPPGEPPRFVPGEHAVDWSLLTRAMLSRVVGAAEMRAEHLLNSPSLLSDAALALVRQGVPAGLVTLAEDDGPLLTLALRDRVELRVVVSTERLDASAGAARLVASLLRPDAWVLALLGPDAVAALHEAAAGLWGAASGSTATVRMQDLRAAGVAQTPGIDTDVLVRSRNDEDGHLALLLLPKT